MSEERTNMAIKDLKHYVIDNMSLDVQDDFEIICKYITNLQQKVEQLEKENKELRQPQVFIDCEDMEERYGRDLYEDYLKGKIEQLENIRKDAIEYVRENVYIDYYGVAIFRKQKHVDSLLNILNKGSE